MRFLHVIMNKVFIRKSMQYQLLMTYLVINLISLIIVGTLSYRVSANSIIREAKVNNVLLLQAINRNVSSYLKEIKDQSSIFSALITKNYYDDTADTDLSSEENLFYMQKYVSSLVDRGDEYVSVRIFLDNGQIISQAANKNTYKHSYNSPEEVEWQRRMRENNSDSLIFDLHALEVNGLYSFTASQALIHPVTGKRLGYISYDKSLSSIYTYFNEIEYRSGGVMQIVRNNETYLYHSNLALIGKKVEGSIQDRLRTIRADSFIDEVNGQDAIITYNRLLNSDLTIIGSVPLSELTKDFDNLRNITLAVCFLSLLLVLILSYCLSVYMTRSIKQLNTLMARVERGNFDVSEDETVNANREIHQLNNSFHSMVHTINQLIKSQYEAELRKKDAELKALLMQINPHFLYNTLEVINGIADYEGVEQISEITQSLSKMLRYNIDLSKEQVRIADELENIRNFVLILKSRFEDQLEVQWEIDEQVGEFMIVKMVLQPLLENAIRHGVEKKLGIGSIHISAMKSGERIEIRIMDNGVGFQSAKLNEFERYKRMAPHSLFNMTSVKNLGLKNVYTRLYIVFGEELNFDIDSVETKGTTITIRFPAIEC